MLSVSEPTVLVNFAELVRLEIRFITSDASHRTTPDRRALITQGN